LKGYCFAHSNLWFLFAPQIIDTEFEAWEPFWTPMPQPFTRSRQSRRVSAAMGQALLSFTLLNFILAMIGTSWHVVSFVLPSN
jgi:hypothetical protein